MATTALTIRLLDFLLIFSLILLVVIQQKINAQEEELIRLENPRLKNCRIDKIYQLGDSLSDTGNCNREALCKARLGCSRYPYGINFFQNQTTGRCSNGMIMVDFIALESGLPLLNAYKNENANFGHGVNFAVSGATALSAEMLEEKKIVNTVTNSSLNVQLDWMSSHFETTCSSDCPSSLKNSLFIVGEIGGNDFNYGLFKGQTINELRPMVPEVIQTIIHGVRRVIGFGATRIVVPGNFPIGCLPVFLAQFRTNDSTAYDKSHCLKDLNNLAIFYNYHLIRNIQKLKKEYPKITLIYGDYYNAYFWLLRNAVSLGFDKNSLQKACCGGGGDYCYNTCKKCGFPEASACIDPSTYISWDGIHMTEKAYSWLAKWLIHDMLPKLNCQAA